MEEMRRAQVRQSSVTWRKGDHCRALSSLLGDNRANDVESWV